MPALIIMDAYPNYPEDWNILQDEDGMENRVFESSDAASAWLERNAKNGWCTMILPVDED